MRQLKITWTVTADVSVPDDTDLDELRKWLGDKHRLSSHYHTYGEEAQIRRETFEIEVIDIAAALEEAVQKAVLQWDKPPRGVIAVTDSNDDGNEDDFPF